MDRVNIMLRTGRNVFQMMDSFQVILAMAGKYYSKIKACIYVFKLSNTTNSDDRLSDMNTK